MALLKSRELLGHPVSSICHNMAGDGECEGVRNIEIGQSAAKRLGDKLKVQRSAYGVLPVCADKMVKCHECGTMFLL